MFDWLESGMGGFARHFKPKKIEPYFFQKSDDGNIHLCFEKDGRIISVAKSMGHPYGLISFCKTHGIPPRFNMNAAFKDFADHVKKHPSIFQ